MQSQRTVNQKNYSEAETSEWLWGGKTMFKLLAGILLSALGLYASRHGYSWCDLYIVPGIALIGAGLDTIFYKKWF